MSVSCWCTVFLELMSVQPRSGAWKTQGGHRGSVAAQTPLPVVFAAPADALPKEPSCLSRPKIKFLNR